MDREKILHIAKDIATLERNANNIIALLNSRVDALFEELGITRDEVFNGKGKKETDITKEG